MLAAGLAGCDGDEPRPEESSASPPKATPTDIPAGFLLYDAEATAEPYQGKEYEGGSLGWKRSDTVTEPWDAQACKLGAALPSDTGRVASRKLSHHLLGDGGASEHVAVYRDEAAAAKAVADFRADYQRCATTERYNQRATHTATPYDLGDESLTLIRSGQIVDVFAAVVVQRGTAVALYWQFGLRDPAEVAADAKRMTTKLCRYDADCPKAGG